MKNLSNTLFPLLLLLILALLTFWLRQATQMDEVKNTGKLRHDPDYIIYNATARQFDADGRVKSTLRSVEARHFPDDETTHFIKPTLLYQHLTRPNILTSAKSGIATKGAERVDLTGDVNITRDASPKRAAMHAVMDNFTAFPNEEKGETASAVKITEGNSWANGIGLKIDMVRETYELQSQARALIAPRK